MEFLRIKNRNPLGILESTVEHRKGGFRADKTNVGQSTGACIKKPAEYTGQYRRI